jgi:hypothetical protein
VTRFTPELIDDAAEYIHPRWLACQLRTPKGGTVNASPAVFHYVDLGGPKTFTGPQIRLVAVPDLGTLASVTLHVTAIAEITFTVLLPTVVLDPPIEPVHTDGITAHHLLFPPFGQKEFYTVTPLNGSASL